MTSLRFEELTRDELCDLAPEATVVVPVGSTEQHGPHLATGTDFTIVSAVAERAVAQAASHIPVVVTPTLPFGFSHYHLPFGGTISISLSVYLAVLTDIGTSLATDGFRRILFLNGHGGNDASVRAVADRLVLEHGLDVHVAGASYWSCAASALSDLGLGGYPVPGHAGAFETSCLLKVRPDLVRTDRFPQPEESTQPLARADIDGAVVRHPGIWQASDGRTDDSGPASGDIGAQAIAAIADAVARLLIDFHHSTNRPSGGST